MYRWGRGSTRASSACSYRKKHVQKSVGGGDGGRGAGSKVPAVRFAFADQVGHAANLDRRHARELRGAQHGEALHRFDVRAEAVREHERARGGGGDDGRRDAAPDDHRDQPAQERPQQRLVGFHRAHELQPARQGERRAVLEPHVRVVLARAHDGVADRAAVAKTAGYAGVDEGFVVRGRERAGGAARRLDGPDAHRDGVDAVTRGQRGELLCYRADDEDADVGTRWLATHSGPTSRCKRLVRNAGDLPSYAWPTNWKTQPTTNAAIANGHVTNAATTYSTAKPAIATNVAARASRPNAAA